MKKKNHKVRAYLSRALGWITSCLTTTAGVLLYTFVPEINGADDFANAFEEFKLFEEGMKLNMGVALPIIAGLIVFLFVVLKKNKDFFKDKSSIGLMIAIAFMYLAYSLIGIFMSACIGALPGVLAQEFGFEPHYRREIKLAEIDNELKLEEVKESVREEVRERRRRR